MKRVFCDICGAELESGQTHETLTDGLALTAVFGSNLDICDSCLSVGVALDVRGIIMTAWKDACGVGVKKKRRGYRKKTAPDVSDIKPAAVPDGRPPEQTQPEQAAPKRRGRRPKGVSKDDDESGPDAAGGVPVGVVIGTPAAEPAMPVSVEILAEQDAVPGEPEPVGPVSIEAPVEHDIVPEPPVNIPELEPPVSVEVLDRYDTATGLKAPVSAKASEPEKPVNASDIPVRQAVISVGETLVMSRRRGRQPKPRREASGDSVYASEKSRLFKALAKYRTNEGIGSLHSLSEASGVSADQLRRALQAEKFDLDWWRLVEQGLKKIAPYALEN